MNPCGVVGASNLVGLNNYCLHYLKDTGGVAAVLSCLFTPRHRLIAQARAARQVLVQHGDDQGPTRGSSRPQNARDRHARLLRLHVRRRHQVTEEMGAVVTL